MWLVSGAVVGEVFLILAGLPQHLHSDERRLRLALEAGQRGGAPHGRSASTHGAATWRGCSCQGVGYGLEL